MSRSGSLVHPGDPATPGVNANKHRGGFALIWLGLFGWVRQFKSSAVGWHEIFLSCGHLVVPPSSFHMITMLHYMDQSIITPRCQRWANTRLGILPSVYSHFCSDIRIGIQYKMDSSQSSSVAGILQTLTALCAKQITLKQFVNYCEQIIILSTNQIDLHMSSLIIWPQKCNLCVHKRFVGSNVQICARYSDTQSDIFNQLLKFLF